MASVLEAVKGKLSPLPSPAALPIPPDISDRKVRAERRISQGEAMRNLCMRFYRNQQYWYINDQGVLAEQPTTTNAMGGGKPRHRVRTTRNLIMPIVNAKVSQATQRVPSYEINPSSFDPDRVAAASLAEKVAVYGYDKWGLQRVTEKVVIQALVADEGFAWPFWDSSIGPFAETDLGCVGLGDVNVRVLSRNEVGWEPGLDFEESPYWIVKQARPVDSVKAQDGYLGGDLKPDASSDSNPSLKKTQSTAGGASKLVLVTDYLERPNVKYPKGRWITMANSRVIAGLAIGQDDLTGDLTLQARPYPLTDVDGNPVDEPVLHRLSYLIDPESDQDLGLVRFLLDVQRSYNDVNNKILEWKNRCLNPQILAPSGSIKQRIDDTPGAIWFYNPIGGHTPQWQQQPEIPATLFELAKQIQQDAQMIAQTQDPPDQVQGSESLEQFIEQRESQWQSFLHKLASLHSRLMRHLLVLVQKHYTEDRELKIRGRFGWESIDSFRGADLLGENDVRVFSGSIEPLTRENIEKRLAFLVQNFPGQVSKEQAMAALERGTAEELIKGYELDIARANRIIQKIKAGPEALFNVPDRNDNGQDVPGWMPRKFDNLPVMKEVFEQFMKTDEYENLEPGVQEAANLYYDGILQLQAEQQAQQAAQMNSMAEGLGMANAAKPQGVTPQPNLGSPLQNVPPQGAQGAGAGGPPPGPAPNNT